MQEETKTSLKTCSCGYDKNSKFVITHKEYSLFGNLLQIIGISAKPLKIRYQCIKCQEYFDQINDPKGL